MVEFNPEQQKVIALQHGFHACLAPAGSGKTAILTERIIQALQQGINSKDMLCLTFTNRAGINMREKVNQQLNYQTKGLFIGNIHAFCAKFSHVNQVYPKQHLLMDESLSDRLLEQAYDEVLALLAFAPQHIAAELSRVLQHYEISAQNVAHLNVEELDILRNRIQKKDEQNAYVIWNLKAIRLLILPLLSPIKVQLSEEQKGYIRERLRTLDENIVNHMLKYAFAFAVYLHHVYENLKSQYQLYDYDDLILTTLYHIQRHPQAKMSAYRWIQIDEVQDLSPLHWLLLQAISTKDAHVLILGDIYQSIYRFLGASLELTASKLGENLHYLKQNYRSPENLVKIFNDYSAYHFGQHEHQSFTLNPSEARALLHLHRRYDSEQFIDIAEYVRKEVPKDQTTAILFSRNADVVTFSSALKNKGIKHFIISQHDILNSAPALDFLAFLTVLHEPDNRLAWARLLWRFGDLNQHRPKHLLRHDPQFAAIRYLAELQTQGSILSDFIGTSTPYQHWLKRLTFLAKQDAFVFFDTETTGLNHSYDDIVQIAAIDQTSSINLYCQTTKSLAATQHIHHIDAEKLAQEGEPIAIQLQKFMDFAQQKVLVAHNLQFDDQMLNTHLKRHLPAEYLNYQQQEKFCSLLLSKRLFPKLESYKLADLLEVFELDGENTHNAIDDVYAGQQLLNFLLQKIERNLNELDGFIDLGENCLTEFSQKFSALWQQAQHNLQNNQFYLADLFRLFFDYMAQHNFQFYTQDYLNKIEELQDKLLHHAHLHFSHLNDQQQYFSQVIEFYKTAKESDLLTAKDNFVVSTIHRSKGLEFDNVVLPSITQDLFPSFFATKKLNAHDRHHQQEGEQLLQEQKRLLYVALTRAKKKLIIGSYELRSAEIDWSRPRNYRLSYFLDCIANQFETI